MHRIRIGSALVLGGLVAALSAPASARDISVKTPAAVFPYTWTGFYVGANAGYGVGRNQSIYDPSPVPFKDSMTQQPNGMLGGFQGGFNWQVANWVLGAEADYQFSAQKNSTCQFGCNIPPGGVLYALQVEQKMPWFATARARLGYATGPVMTYVTGGAARSKVETQFNETFSNVPGAPISFSATRPGWTLGGGVEAAVAGNWTAKIEYLYLNLGDITHRYASFGTARTWHSNFRNDIYRAGINYRFGGSGAAPAMPPAANWAGFYLGGNVGAGSAHNATSPATFNGDAVYKEQTNLAPHGWIGGVLAGYNWQIANWVYGVESDFQLAGQKDSHTCLMTCNIPVLNTAVAIQQKLDWFGTARGRLGYAVGPALFYATGGFAYAHLVERIRQSTGFGQHESFRFSHTKTGWTAGGGIERGLGLLGPNWIARAEYLYMDLGSVSDTYTMIGFPNTIKIDLHNHVFRSALSYKFGGPVVTNY